MKKKTESHACLPDHPSLKGVFVEGHVHLLTQMAQGAVKVGGASEVDKSTAILVIRHDNDVQPSMLQQTSTNFLD